MPLWRLLLPRTCTALTLPRGGGSAAVITAAGTRHHVLHKHRRQCSFTFSRLPALRLA
jgi:hypothetical protein